MKLHPRTEKLLRRMGEDIRTWRVSQRLSTTAVADRAGITRVTLRRIEKDPTAVSFGNVLAVLAVLGVDEELARAIDPTQSLRGQTILAAAARGEL
jgi:Helix-turn-helix.